MKATKYEGLYAAVATPMTRRGEVDISVVDSYADFLVKRKIKGVFVCGTTGESLLLDTEERKMVAEAWMKYADKLSILVHVGSTSCVVAQRLARHAQEMGADAISAMGPMFMPPDGVEELLEFNRLIAESAPDTPYYYYHIPGVSNVNIDMVEFLKRGKNRISTLRGVKYTSCNLMEEQECIRLDNHFFDILHGHDELLLPGLAVGARGGIGTSFNVTSSLFNQILEAFDREDMSEALRLQSEANSFIKLMLKYENSVVGIKAILNIMGIDCGPCRLPLRNLSLREMKMLEDHLKAFDWIH